MMTKRKRNTLQDTGPSSVFTPLIKRSRITRSTFGSAAELPIVLDSDSDIDSDADLVDTSHIINIDVKSNVRNDKSSVPKGKKDTKNETTTIKHPTSSKKKDLLSPQHLDKAILSIAVKNSLKEMKKTEPATDPVTQKKVDTVGKTEILKKVVEKVDENKKKTIVKDDDKNTLPESKPSSASENHEHKTQDSKVEPNTVKSTLMVDSLKHGLVTARITRGTSHYEKAKAQELQAGLDASKISSNHPHETQKTIENLISSRSIQNRIARATEPSTAKLDNTKPLSNVTKINDVKVTNNVNKINSTNNNDTKNSNNNSNNKTSMHIEKSIIDNLKPLKLTLNRSQIVNRPSYAPTSFDPKSQKTYRNTYSTSCVSCTKKNRGEYCNRQKPCDICVGKKLKKCDYPPDAEIAIPAVFKKNQKPKPYRNINLSDDKENSKTSSLAKDYLSSSNTRLRLTRSNLLDNKKNEQVPLKTSNLHINDTPKVRKLMLKMGKDPKTIKPSKVEPESTSISESDSESSAESEAGSESEESESDELSSDDEYDDDSSYKGSSKSNASKSSSPGNNFEKAQRLLKNLEYEKRDVNVYVEGRRRRAATRGNYYIPSDPENDSDADGYAAAEARNEQLILSEDEEERRMLRGELDMDYINSLRRERAKKVVQESDDSSDEDEIFFG